MATGTRCWIAWKSVSITSDEQGGRNMDSVGIGMIGSGFMGITYSEAVANHARGCHLVAIAGGRRAPALAADYEVPAEADVDALLARDDVDAVVLATPDQDRDRKSTRLNSSHKPSSYAGFCLEKKKKTQM